MLFGFRDVILKNHPSTAKKKSGTGDESFATAALETRRDPRATLDRDPPLELGVCRCCDNGVTCQFALLLFVEKYREQRGEGDGGRAVCTTLRGKG